MALGRSFQEWHYTSAVQATLANTVRDEKRKRKPFYTRDFHPHILQHEAERREREGVPDEQKLDVSILKSVFVDDVPIGKVMAFHGLED